MQCRSANHWDSPFRSGPQFSILVGLNPAPRIGTSGAAGGDGCTPMARGGLALLRKEREVWGAPPSRKSLAPRTRPASEHAQRPARPSAWRHHRRCQRFWGRDPETGRCRSGRRSSVREPRNLANPASRRFPTARGANSPVTSGTSIRVVTEGTIQRPRAPHGGPVSRNKRSEAVTRPLRPNDSQTSDAVSCSMVPRPSGSRPLFGRAG